MKKRHTEERVIAILREAEAAGTDPGGVCRKHNISPITFARWRRRYGGMEVSDARKLKDLQAENAKLKRMVAEQLLTLSRHGDMSAFRKSENPIELEGDRACSDALR